VKERWRAASPVFKTGLAMFVVACAVFAILVVRLIAAGGQPAFVGQDVDMPAAGLVLASLVFGIWMTRRPRSIPLPDATDRRLLVLAVAVLIVLAVGAVWTMGTAPATPDEQAALFQARLFSHFKVIDQYPVGLVDQMLVPKFQGYIVLVGADGRAMSIYWPGWALLMTPFVWLGVPWLLGPVTASSSVLLIGKLARLLGGAQAATVALFLALTSGTFVLTGMSVFPAAGHLALSLLFAWLLLRGGMRDAFLAGLVGSLALVLNNPFPHAVFALPWGIWLLADPARRKRLIPLALAYVPGLVVLVGWVMLQGSLRTTDSSAAGAVWFSRLSLLISVPTLTSLGYRFWELCRAWAWAAPGLMVVAWVGWRSTRDNIGVRLLGASFISTVVLYVLFPGDQGLGYGARYYYVAWGVLPILAGVQLVKPGWERLRNTALAAALVGFFLVVPLETSYAHGLAGLSDKPIAELSKPGVNLVFIDLDKELIPGITLNNNPSTQGFLVLISRGPVADQALVDKWFPGSRLVVTTDFGSGYSRP